MNSRKRKYEEETADEKTQTRFYTLDGKLLCSDTRNAYVFNTVTSGVLGMFPIGGETLPELEKRIAKKLRPLAATLLFAHFFGSGHASPWLVNASRPSAHIRIFQARVMKMSSIGWAPGEEDEDVLACKFVSAGARSPNASAVNIQKIMIRLGNILKCRFVLLRTRLRNFLLSLRLTRELDLTGIAERHDGMINYNKSSFPGCPIKFYRPAASLDGRLEPAPRPVRRSKNKSEDGDWITATCFASGVVMIAGCKSIQDGVSTFGQVIPLILPFARGPAPGVEEVVESIETKTPARVSQKDRRRLGNQTHRALSPNDKEWYLSKRFTPTALAAFPFTPPGPGWDAFLAEAFGTGQIR